MAKFKNERDWSELERADKIALFVGLAMWLAIETGCFLGSMHSYQNNQQAKHNIFKTLVVGKNR